MKPKRVQAERGARNEELENAEWITVRLGDVVEIERSGVDPASLPPGCTYVGLEHMDSNGQVQSGATISGHDVKSTKFRFDSRHVLFGKLRPYLRKTARPGFSGICSTDILPLLPSATIDRDYLYHWLRTDEIVLKATQSCSGANLPRLSPQALRAFEFRVPRSLVAQKRIAGILDAADALRAKRRAALAQLDALAQSLFLDLFGDPVTNPKGWEVVAFDDIVADSKIGLVRSSNEFGWNLSLPYVRMDSVTLDGTFLPEKVQFTEASEKEKAEYSLQPGDFLFNTRNSKELVGKVCVFPGPEGWLFNNNLMRVRFRKGVESTVIAMQFRFSQVQRELEQRKSGTTSVFAIYWKSLRTLPLLNPPAKVQQQFAAAVEAIERQKARQREQLAGLDALFASLQHRAFRGEL